MTHSPGPWTVSPGVYDTNPETACEFPRGPEIMASESHGIIASLPMYGELNAHLIAAAPDMYEYIKECADGGDEVAAAIITKATGG